ncbi:MAG TPA: hypothetical protein VI386_31985 [Candidatus Sulfotelmatobacter sp.]
MTLLELTFQRRKADIAAHEILDLAVTEGRNLNVAEQVRFDGLLARVHELDAAIAKRAALRQAA